MAIGSSSRDCVERKNLCHSKAEKNFMELGFWYFLLLLNSGLKNYEKYFSLLCNFIVN